jgi:YesN/AraC family two-component response regulator
MILLVEDEAIIRLGLAEVFERAGFRVIEAGDGVDAVRLLVEHSDISIVVSDVDMPRMNGLQLTETVQRMYPAIKIVLTSGISYVRAETLPPGVRFFEKPIRDDELVACICELTSGSGIGR